MFHKFWNNKFFKFLIVGGINTVFGYSVFALLIFLNMHYSLAALFSQISGVLFNFKTTGKIVFNNSNNMLIFKFTGVYLITYFLNVGILKLFTYTSLNMYEAGAITLLPMALISFFLNKNLVFNCCMKNK